MATDMLPIRKKTAKREVFDFGSNTIRDLQSFLDRHRTWAVFGERKLQYYEEPLLDNEKVDALLASLQPTLPSVDIATPKDFLHSYARGNGEQV